MVDTLVEGFHTQASPFISPHERFGSCLNKATRTRVSRSTHTLFYEKPRHPMFMRITWMQYASTYLTFVMCHFIVASTSDILTGP